MGSLVVLAPPSQASTTLAKLYEHPNFGGALASFATWQDGYFCTTTLSDVDVALPISGYMDNKTSSFKTYNLCWVKFFDASNYTGTSWGYSSGSTQLPSSIENRPSSLYIS